MFIQRGSLVPRDASPWQRFSGKGMAFRLQSYDWNGCACVSHLTMKAFGGIMKMESLICTPYSKNLPLYSYDRISAFGRQSLLLELYNTMLGPVSLPALDAVKESYRDLKDKKTKPNWYDTLRLSPSTFKAGSKARLGQLSQDMTAAYLDCFDSASDVERQLKTRLNSAYVEGLIGSGGPAIDTISGILGEEETGTLFRRFIFGTE